MAKQTPWVPAQTAELLADGIVSYGTASHGGIGLSTERQKQIAGLHANNFLGGVEWWEEDCDWAVPYVFFSDAIREHGTAYRFAENLEAAKRTVAGYHKECAPTLAPETTSA